MFDVKLVTTRHTTACGPACLKMLLGYYGIEAELDTLIEECGVTVNGCTAGDLIRVGRAHGLAEMSSWQEGLEDVFRQDRPAIIWWQYNHFIVYCGLNDAGEPVIANPMRGRYAIDRGTFAALCSGFQPGTCVALCNGKPLDITLKAAANYEEGELFEAGGNTCVALRPIARGETLRAGFNYSLTTIIDALNSALEEE